MNDASPPRPPPDHDASAPLDAELRALLDASIAPEPADAALAARVKHRVLRRIAEDDTRRHHTVQPDGGRWQPFGRGVQIKVLHEAGGVMSYLLKIAPGAQVPAHRHPVDEECVVLEGSVRIGQDLVVHAGGFHLARRDALHAAISSDAGAVIFLRGATPEASHVV